MTAKLLTTTLSTGETVLAKMEKIADFSPHELDPIITQELLPLRYGNETAAEKKLNSIQPLLSHSRSASIVKQDGRFLIFIYDKPGYQSISNEDVSRMLTLPQGKLSEYTPSSSEAEAAHNSSFENLCSQFNWYKGLQSLKALPVLFATVSGRRQNPRNRHNHNHKDQTDQPYYFGE